MMCGSDNPDLRRPYEEDGFLVFLSVLDSESSGHAGEHVERLQRRNPELRPEQLPHHLTWTDPFWLRLVADARLLNRVEPIIGPNIALFACPKTFVLRGVAVAGINRYSPFPEFRPGEQFRGDLTENRHGL